MRRGFFRVGRFGASGRHRLGRLGLVLAAFALLAAAPSYDETGHLRDRLVIYVPSTEGGGWDQTAAAMKQALEADGLAREVVIVRRPGAGGLVGLAQFVEARRGDPRFLIVGGASMVYSAKANESAVSLLNTTPIARLAADHLTIAVPVSSPLHSLGDLRAVLKTRPSALHWAGGVAGGPDEQLAWRLLADAGADPQSLAYAPKAGASEAAIALEVGDPQLVAVLGYSEVMPFVANGRARVLAVAAEGTRFRGLPTFRSDGVDVVAANWRGVFAPPQISPEARAELVDVMSRMAKGRIWRETLQRRGWTDAFLAADDFAAFVNDEQQRIFAMNPPVGHKDDTEVARLLAWRLWIAPLALGVVALAIAIAVVWRWRGRRDRQVRASLAPIERLEDGPGVAEQQWPVVAAINREFDAWKLSTAERDVAWFLLKGLPMKEIARLRDASERTVRQQARAVYAKAGLDGRSDLAAHILDQCLAPVAPMAVAERIEA